MGIETPAESQYDLYRRVGALEAQVNSHTTAIADVRGEVSKVGAAVQSVKDLVDNQQHTLDSINGKMGALDDMVATKQNTVVILRFMKGAAFLAIGVVGAVVAIQTGSTELLVKLLETLVGL